MYAVPEDEIRFRATRGGGPGGQHVNTSSTRVEALWDVAGTPSLSQRARERVLRKLGRRVGADGVLRVVAAERRSQLQNREAAVRRLNALVAQALHEPKPRKATKPSRKARERRLAAKRRRGELKRSRRPDRGEE